LSSQAARIRITSKSTWVNPERRTTVMVRTVAVLVVLAASLIGCAALEPYIAPPPADRGQPPLVLDSYAAPSIRPGEPWLVFLRAEDPDGDMKSIAAVLWQAGVGFYPTEVTMLKPGFTKAFSGYLYLRTPVDFTLNWDEFELTLYIRDGLNNRAQPVKFPLRFDMAAKQVVPEKWRDASNTVIAPLMIPIESAHRYNRSGDNDWD
jgi:hypothetical protein